MSQQNKVEFPSYERPNTDVSQVMLFIVAFLVSNRRLPGVRLIIVGSPGCVDSETFRGNPELADHAAGYRADADRIAEGHLRP